MEDIGTFTSLGLFGGGITFGALVGAFFAPKLMKGRENKISLEEGPKNSGYLRFERFVEGSYINEAKKAIDFKDYVSYDLLFHPKKNRGQGIIFRRLKIHEDVLQVYQPQFSLSLEKYRRIHVHYCRYSACFQRNSQFKTIPSCDCSYPVRRRFPHLKKL